VEGYLLKTYNTSVAHTPPIPKGPRLLRHHGVLRAPAWPASILSTLGTFATNLYR